MTTVRLANGNAVPLGRLASMSTNRSELNRRVIAGQTGVIEYTHRSSSGVVSSAGGSGRVSYPTSSQYGLFPLGGWSCDGTAGSTGPNTCVHLQTQYSIIPPLSYQ